MAYVGIYLIVIVYFSFQKNECKKPRKWRDSIYRFRGPRQSGLWVTCEVFGFRKISMWTNLKKKTRGRFLLQVKEISWRYNICNEGSWTLSWSGWWKEKNNLIHGPMEAEEGFQSLPWISFCGVKPYYLPYLEFCEIRRQREPSFDIRWTWHFNSTI